MSKAWHAKVVRLKKLRVNVCVFFLCPRYFTSIYIALPKVESEKADTCTLLGVMAQRGKKKGGKKHVFHRAFFSIWPKAKSRVLGCDNSPTS